MVTLSFVFDDAEVDSSGYTRDELLEPMREHAKKYGITELADMQCICQMNL